jgi:hypothetical protein
MNFNVKAEHKFFKHTLQYYGAAYYDITVQEQSYNNLEQQA